MQGQLRHLVDRVRNDGLVISAVAPLIEGDGFDGAFRSIALLSPDPNTFWESFSTSTEAKDGQSDPIDRWSRSVVIRIADDIGGIAEFPFDGPPYLPFSMWAQRARVAWKSPSGLLVHADFGLWISFRGAIALTEPVELLDPEPSPCETCPRPCLSECPVGALSQGNFDYGACLGHVQSGYGIACLDSGCLARRACPVGQQASPPLQQLRTHMKAFANMSGA